MVKQRNKGCREPAVGEGKRVRTTMQFRNSMAGRSTEPSRERAGEGVPRQRAAQPSSALTEAAAAVPVNAKAGKMTGKGNSPACSTEE